MLPGIQGEQRLKVLERFKNAYARLSAWGR